MLMQIKCLNAVLFVLAAAAVLASGAPDGHGQCQVAKLTAGDAAAGDEFNGQGRTVYHDQMEQGPACTFLIEFALRQQSPNASQTGLRRPAPG